jgi:hypothetical protein
MERAFTVGLGQYQIYFIKQREKHKKTGRRQFSAANCNKKGKMYTAQREAL